MRFRRRYHVIQILVLLSFCSASDNDRAQETEKKRTIFRTVIFAVLEGGDVTIDPIVIIDRGRYLKPPDGIEEDAGHFAPTIVSIRC